MDDSYVVINGFSIEKSIKVLPYFDVLTDDILRYIAKYWFIHEKLSDPKFNELIYNRLITLPQIFSMNSGVLESNNKFLSWVIENEVVKFIDIGSINNDIKNSTLTLTL